jgi:RNA polymerase sigma-70 factor (ECF subfamily)
MVLVSGQWRGRTRHALSRPDSEVDISPEICREIEILFRAESKALFRYACTIPEVDRAKAEDLVQTTFLATIDNWPQLGPLDPEEQRKWLHTVLKNKAIDQWRKGRRLRLTDEYDETEMPVLSDIADQALCAVALDRAWNEITSMPEQRQKVAFLSWNEGWSTREVADWLGIAQGTVRSHLKLARDQLVKVAKTAPPFIEDHETGGLGGQKAGS